MSCPHRLVDVNGDYPLPSNPSLSASDSFSTMALYKSIYLLTYCIVVVIMSYQQFLPSNLAISTGFRAVGRTAVIKVIIIIIPRRCLWYCHRDKVTARVHLKNGIVNQMYRLFTEPAV